MKFKIGDKVKVISLNNSFGDCATMEKNYFFLNKTFTVYDLIHDTKQFYVTVKENIYYWNTKDLILINNRLEIE